MKISEHLLLEIRTNSFVENELMISGSDFSNEDMLKLLNALKLNNRIKKIIFWEIERIDEEYFTLLASLTNLETIIFSESYLTNSGARELLKSKVKSLYLNSNNLNDTCLEGIEDNKTLIELSLCANEFTEIGIEMLSKHKSIKKLMLAQCNLHDSSTPYLCAMKSLEILDLDHNMITDVGFKNLNDSNIKEIYLGSNWNDNLIKHITPERLQLRECAKRPSPTPAFEASKKREKLEREKPERKEQAEKEAADAEVEASSKRLKPFTGT